MSTPGVPDLDHVAGVLEGWQYDAGPLHLHRGDLGWHSLRGAATTAASLRAWSHKGEIFALGLLDGPDLLRMAVDPDLRDDEELARQLHATSSTGGEPWPRARATTGAGAWPRSTQTTTSSPTTVWSAGPGRPGLIEPMGVHRDHQGPTTKHLRAIPDALAPTTTGAWGSHDLDALLPEWWQARIPRRCPTPC